MPAYWPSTAHHPECHPQRRRRAREFHGRSGRRVSRPPQLWLPKLVGGRRSWVDERAEGALLIDPIDADIDRVAGEVVIRVEIDREISLTPPMLHRLIGGAAFDENVDGLAPEGLPELKAVARGELIEQINPLIHHRPVHKIIRPSRGRRA